jgi:hypothetical protein
MTGPDEPNNPDEELIEDLEAPVSDQEDVAGGRAPVGGIKAGGLNEECNYTKCRMTADTYTQVLADCAPTRDCQAR